jgi:hypothetical protein
MIPVSPLWLAHRPQLRAVPPQKQRCRHPNSEEQKRQQAIPPSIPKTPIHFRCEERERKASQTQKLGGRRCRSNIFAIRIHDIGLHGLGAENGGADVR